MVLGIDYRADPIGPTHSALAIIDARMGPEACMLQGQCTAALDPSRLVQRVISPDVADSAPRVTKRAGDKRTRHTFRLHLVQQRCATGHVAWRCFALRIASAAMPRTAVAAGSLPRRDDCALVAHRSSRRQTWLSLHARLGNWSGPCQAGKGSTPP